MWRDAGLPYLLLKWHCKFEKISADVSSGFA